METFQIAISDDDVALLNDLAAIEKTDISGLIAIKTSQLVDYRKRAAAKELLTARLAKLAYADSKTLADLDATALPLNTDVSAEVAASLQILGRK